MRSALLSLRGAAKAFEDTGNRIGVVHAIAGYVHGDFHFTGRADHAGATPMAARTWDAATLPDEQADPEEIAIPWRSSAISRVSAEKSGNAKALVLGRR